MGMCFAVTSGKGGTGKSTFSAGLALAFATLGKEVLLIDMDEGLRCLDLMLGVEEELVFDLSDLLAGRDLCDAVYSVRGQANVSLIPAPRELGKLPPAELEKFLAATVLKYDILILDFPAGIDFSLYNCLPQGSSILAVCNPDPISVRDAAVVCDNLPQASLAPRLVLNKFVYETVRNGIYKNIDEIIDASGFRLLGVIPQDSELSYFAVNHTLKKRGRAMRAFQRIARRLLGEQIKLPRPKKI